MRRFVLITAAFMLTISAEAQDRGFLVANPADDTLFYVAPNGYLKFGVPDAHVTMGENGEGLWSIITRAEGAPSAGLFQIRNPESQAVALYASTNGSGPASYGYSAGSGAAVSGQSSGMGPAGEFVTLDNPANTRAALIGSSWGQGPGLLAASYSDGAQNIAEFITGTSLENGRAVATIAKTGDIWAAGDINADGVITGAGADFAERFEVIGETASYEAGDVLVISANADRHLERAAEPYSTLIAGVYATRPGLLLADPDIAPESTVPVGVVGVIPTKVTLEGGPIRRGDLLVTSSTLGHAMRGNPAMIRTGMVLGKALQNFDGEAAGVIEVLVNVQ